MSNLPHSHSQINEASSLAGGTSPSASPAPPKNHLKSASTTLYVIGAFTVALNLVFMSMAQTNVERELEAYAASLKEAGQEPDPAELQQIKENAIRLTRLTAGGLLVMGVVIAGLGALTRYFPVPCTILAFVLFIGSGIVTAVINPSSLAQGMVVKIAVIVFLIRAIQSAQAYQQEQATATG